MTDIQLLYISSIITFLITFILYRFSKKAFSVVLSLFIIYSLFFYYLFFYEGKYGSSLVWMVYLLALYIVHVLAVLGYVVVKVVKKPLNKHY